MTAQEYDSNLGPLGALFHAKWISPEQLGLQRCYESNVLRGINCNYTFIFWPTTQKVYQNTPNDVRVV